MLTSQPAVTEPRTGAQRLRSAVRELLIVVVGALVVSSLLRAFVGQMFIIPSESMESTLLVDDRVVVLKPADYQRGDIVVFSDPGGWLDEHVEERGPVGKVFEFVGVLPKHTGAEHLIKRVIGMPGDRVVCCDPQNRVTVNGQPLDESDYLYSDPDGIPVEPSEVDFDVTVPRDRLFVMGDHRDVSGDSRCHLSDVSVDGKGMTAFIPLDRVVGPAVAVAFPVGRAQTFDRPVTYADVPAPAEPAPEAPVIKPDGVTC